MASLRYIPKVNAQTHHADILARLPTTWKTWPNDASSVNCDEALQTFLKRSQKDSFSWPKKTGGIHF